MLERNFPYVEDPNHEMWMASPKIVIPNKQIYKINGKTTFIEFMGDAMAIDRIKINMLSYDNNKEKGNKITKSLDFYLSLAEALSFCEEVLNNNLARKIQKEKKLKEENAAYFQKPVFIKQGGISAEDLAKRNKSRSDGKALFRKFSVIVSSSTNADIACAFLLERGPGKKSPTSGIISDYSGLKALSGKEDGYSLIAISGTDLKNLAAILKATIMGYITAQYALVGQMQEINYLFQRFESSELANQKMLKIMYKHILATDEATQKMMSAPTADTSNKINNTQDVSKIDKVEETAPKTNQVFDEVTGELISDDLSDLYNEDVPF